MLFESRFHEGLRSGSIRKTFRLWTRAMVIAGHTYRVRGVGLLAVLAVKRVRVGDISAKDARSAGFESNGSLRDYLERVAKRKITDRTTVFCIALHFAGEDDRSVLARDGAPPPDELASLVDKPAEPSRLLDARSARAHRATSWCRRLEARSDGAAGAPCLQARRAEAQGPRPHDQSGQRLRALPSRTGRAPPVAVCHESVKHDPSRKGSARGPVNNVLVFPAH